VKDLKVEAPSKKIKKIMESIHDPLENSEGIEYEPESSEDSFITESSFNTRGDLVKKDKFNTSGNLEWREIYTYDGNRNNTEIIFYHFKTITFKKINVFDNSNRLMESNVFDTSGKNTGRQTVGTDGNGRKVVHEYAFVKGNLVKTSESLYDQTDHHVENQYFSDRRVTLHEIHQYDTAGNRIQTFQHYPLKNQERTTYFKYDARNNNTETIVLNSSVMIESKVVTTYNDRNNVVQLLTYGINGNLKEYKKHAYEYDEAGNWTKDILFVNQKPVSVTVRKVEYF